MPKQPKQPKQPKGDAPLRVKGRGFVAVVSPSGVVEYIRATATFATSHGLSDADRKRGWTVRPVDIIPADPTLRNLIEGNRAIVDAALAAGKPVSLVVDGQTVGTIHPPKTKES